MTVEVTIDLNALKVKHAIELERLKTLEEYVQWLVKHGGVTEGDALELPFADLHDTIQKVRKTLADGLLLPKANGSKSSSESKPGSDGPSVPSS